MTTITIPINDSLNDFVNEQVRIGNASSKADLVRRAIQKMKEDEFVQMVLAAKREIKDGKILKGDLDQLAKGFE
ncbi:MAG: hypothetical protein WC763_00540 [Candidatus Paceibacterota bacterium]|jgi:Arc/MetJ-type ribon-helix-helix transcriptional regulator